MMQSECVYSFIAEGYIHNKQRVLKVGRTVDLKRRLKGYSGLDRPDAKSLNWVETNNSINVERILKRMLCEVLEYHSGTERFVVPSGIDCHDIIQWVHTTINFLATTSIVNRKCCKKTIKKRKREVNIVESSEEYIDNSSTCVICDQKRSSNEEDENHADVFTAQHDEATSEEYIDNSSTCVTCDQKRSSNEEDDNHADVFTAQYDGAKKESKEETKIEDKYQIGLSHARFDTFHGSVYRLWEEYKILWQRERENSKWFGEGPINRSNRNYYYRKCVWYREIMRQIELHHWDVESALTCVQNFADPFFLDSGGGWERAEKKLREITPSTSDEAARLNGKLQTIFK